VAEVIARRLLDAAKAVQEDPDASQIREQGVAESVRPADRARRTGAQNRAAMNYADAAERSADARQSATLSKQASHARAASGFNPAVEDAEG
jgi:hypothetical protein